MRKQQYIADVDATSGLPQRTINILNNNFRVLVDSTSAASLSGTVAPVAISGDYNDLDGKPSIENVTLVDNKNFPDLGIFIDSDYEMEEHPQSDRYAMTADDINALWNGGL